MTKLTAARLDEIKSQARKKSGDWIKVGLSTCGISAGADKVFKALNEEKERRGI